MTPYSTIKRLIRRSKQSEQFIINLLKPIEVNIFKKKTTSSLIGSKVLI